MTGCAPRTRTKQALWACCPHPRPPLCVPREVYPQRGHPRIVGPIGTSLRERASRRINKLALWARDILILKTGCPACSANDTMGLKTKDENNKYNGRDEPWGRPAKRVHRFTIFFRSWYELNCWAGFDENRGERPILLADRRPARPFYTRMQWLRFTPPPAHAAGRAHARSYRKHLGLIRFNNVAHTGTSQPGKDYRETAFAGRKKNISLLENDKQEIEKKRALQLAKAFNVQPAIIMFPEYEGLEIHRAA